MLLNKSKITKIISEKHIIYKSHEARFLLGTYPLNLDRGMQIASDLEVGIQNAPRIHEALQIHRSYGGRFLAEEKVCGRHISFGILSLKIEQLYINHEGRLNSVGDLFLLAEFKKEEEDAIFMRVHKLDQIGVNPGFLYEIGATYEI